MIEQGWEVHKFGGTSVGDHRALRNIAEIAKYEQLTEGTIL